MSRGYSYPVVIYRNNEDETVRVENNDGVCIDTEYDWLDPSHLYDLLTALGFDVTVVNTTND